MSGKSTPLRIRAITRANSPPETNTTRPSDWPFNRLLKPLTSFLSVAGCPAAYLEYPAGLSNATHRNNLGAGGPRISTGRQLHDDDEDDEEDEEDDDDDVGTAAVTYRLNIFWLPGGHQWSITGGQRAGHPGRQVRAKLRLRSNIRVITRYYTEHVDTGGGWFSYHHQNQHHHHQHQHHSSSSPPPPPACTTSFTCSSCPSTIISTITVHLLLVRLRRLSPSPSLARTRGPRSFSAPGNPSVLLLSSLALYITRSLARSRNPRLVGHDRERSPCPSTTTIIATTSATGCVSLLCMRFLPAARDYRRPRRRFERLGKFSGIIVQFSLRSDIRSVNRRTNENTVPLY